MRDSILSAENDVLRYRYKEMTAEIREIKAAIKGRRGELAKQIRDIIKDYES